MSKITRFQLLLLMHFFSGRIVGKTKLQKLMFLIEKEKPEGYQIDEDYDFEPHLFGPYSPAVLKDEEILQLYGWVQEKQLQIVLDSGEVINTAKYEITQEGRDFVTRAILRRHPELEKIIEKIVEQFGSLPTNKLLRHVYEKYPEFTTKSVLSLSEL